MARPFSLSVCVNLAATTCLFVLIAVPSPARAGGDSFESGTFAALPWEMSPAEAWQVVAGDAADGAYAARSAPLADGGAAVLEVTLAISSPGEVAF